VYAGANGALKAFGLSPSDIVVSSFLTSQLQVKGTDRIAFS